MPVNTERERDLKASGSGETRVSGTGVRHGSPSPIQFHVRLPLEQLDTYWNTHEEERKRKGSQGSVLGHRLAAVMTCSKSATLYLQGPPALREVLTEALLAAGFTDFRVIPDESYPYEWLREAREPDLE